MKSCYAGGGPGRALAWPAGGLKDFLNKAAAVVFPTNSFLFNQHIGLKNRYWRLRLCNDFKIVKNRSKSLKIVMKSFEIVIIGPLVAKYR